MTNTNQPKPVSSEETYSEEEVKIAKLTRETVIEESDVTISSIYMAGEIVMWDEMQGKLTEANRTIEEQKLSIEGLDFLNTANEKRITEQAKEIASLKQTLRDKETSVIGFRNAIERRAEWYVALKQAADEMRERLISHSNALVIIEKHTEGRYSLNKEIEYGKAGVTTYDNLTKTQQG